MVISAGVWRVFALQCLTSSRTEVHGIEDLENLMVKISDE